MSNRRNFCKNLSALPLLSAMDLVQAQDNKRQMSMVVPYTPGGSTDVLGRIFTDAFSGLMGEKVILENRPGANGTLGVSYVASAPADGRTLLYTYGNLMLNQEFMMKDTKLRPLDVLVPIARTCIIQAVIVAAPNFPANNLRDLIAMAKRNPGKHTYAYYGDLGIASMASEAGINLLRVPYKGGVPGMIDVMSETVDIMTNSLAQALPQLRAGKLKVLAVFGDERLTEWPNIATVKETLPNYRAFDYQVVMASKATPRPILEQLAQRANAALSSPDIKKAFLDRGALVSNLGLNELQSFMELDRANITNIVKIAGIQAE